MLGWFGLLFLYLPLVAIFYLVGDWGPLHGWYGTTPFFLALFVLMLEVILGGKLGIGVVPLIFLNVVGAVAALTVTLRRDR